MYLQEIPVKELDDPPDSGDDVGEGGGLIEEMTDSINTIEDNK